MKIVKKQVELAAIAAIAIAILDACAPAAKEAVGDMMVGAGGVLAELATGGTPEAGTMAGDGGGPMDGGGSVVGMAGQMLIDAGTAINGHTGGSTAGAQDPPNASGSRIQLRYEVSVGTDGTRFKAPAWPVMYDTLLRTACGLFPAEDGQQRCLPQTSIQVGTYYSDASCIVPVAHGSSVYCATEYAYENLVDDGCLDSLVAWPRKVYRVQSPYTGGLFQKGAQGCVATQSVASFSYFNVAPMAPTEFVGFASTIEEP